MDHLCYFCLAFIHVCLLGKDWTLGSRLLCLLKTLSLSHWYPRSVVVLDCIDS